MSSWNKPFVLDQPRFDQTNYYGRLRHNASIGNPLLLLKTKKQIEAACKLLDDYKNGVLDYIPSNKELWKAQTLKQSAVHPQDGHIIPWYARQAGFMPTNLPIILGFSLSPPTFWITAFWQWVNQSYNAAFNYHNRNTTNPESTGEIGKAYAIASTVSVATAVGLNNLVPYLPFKNHFLKMISYRFVPYFACCAASSFNAIIMRYKELMKGVELTDNEGNKYGISKKAGIKVIKSIVCSRVVLPIPGVLLPPLLMYSLKYMKIAPQGKIAGFLFDSALCTFTCTIALPIAVSIFPGWMKIKSSELEEEFQNLCDAHGNVIDKFIVSKGV